MLSFYLIWSLSYLILLVWISSYWPAKKKTYFSQDLSEVTLLIPFRNEIENAAVLTESVKKLSTQKIKILLIDDQSEDNSFSFLSDSLQELSNVKVLKSPEAGKKAAIEFGVKMVDTALILCSDADCCWSESWVSAMVGPFSDRRIKLVAGPVMVMAKADFMSRFQQLDWASILLLTNFGFVKQHPIMCSAANFAYRKSAFESVGGYAGNRKHSSGDDEFLLKKIHEKFGASASTYLPEPAALVSTLGELTWRDLINQRIRWAGKIRAKASLSNRVPAVLVLWGQVMWLGSFVLLTMGVKGVLAFSMIWLVKLLAERFALGKVLKSLEVDLLLLHYLKTSIVHPFYSIMVAYGAIRGKFTWKGRENFRSVNLESDYQK